MFGLIVAGRLVQTEFTQVSEDKVVFTVEHIDNANHIVVFMTGQTPFPDLMGGAVYISVPNAAGQSWFHLGHISNSKPSAIFKIINLKTEGDGSQLANPFAQMSMAKSHMAQLGIAAKPLEELTQMTPTANTNVSTVDTFMDFSTKTLENMFQYVSSFAITPSQMHPSHATQTFVPLNSLQNWFQTFQRRLQVNPYFWRK